MSKKAIMAGLSAVVLFQVFVLATEYLNAVYPLWTGQEIRLKTVPRDPRSLFRGNYARLNYDISTVPSKDIAAAERIRNHEIVYVKLKPGPDGLHVYDGASLEEPADGLFIRGRVQIPRWQSRALDYRLRYGIEAYFAPKEKALALEKKLRRGGVAKIMIAKNGKATLKEVLPE